MQNHKFKIGDVVYLNSNPEILWTVYGITESGKIAVQYKRPPSKFSYEYGVQSFPPEMLTLVKK
jgi:hypothetical protein